MSKRVYELAKELGLSSRDVRDALARMGVIAKSHSSTVEDGAAAKLKEAVEKGTLRAAPAAPARKAARPARPVLERPSAERAPVRQAPQPAPPPAAAAPAAPAAPAAAEAEAPVSTIESSPAKTLAVHRGIPVQ
jgi:translation initiation factor IF-2